jgi:hypothetical protein
MHDTAKVGNQGTKFEAYKLTSEGLESAANATSETELKAQDVQVNLTSEIYSKYESV